MEDKKRLSQIQKSRKKKLKKLRAEINNLEKKHREKLMQSKVSYEMSEKMKK